MANYYRGSVQFSIAATQFFVGIIFGVLAASYMAVTGGTMEGMEVNYITDLFNIITSALLGYPVGVVIGVWAIGGIFRQRGSVLGMVLGSLLAALLVYALGVYTDITSYPLWYGMLSLSIFPFAATFGYAFKLFDGK